MNATPQAQVLAPALSALPGSRTLVIGYGSPIRGDDAIGPLAAEALGAEPPRPGLVVLARHILTAELAADLAAADRAIFLDAEAAEAGEAPGRVRVRELAPDPRVLSTMAHFHDPRELLAWCETLYGRAPRAWLVTAVGSCFGYAHCRLSPAAAAALPAMLAQARRLIDGAAAAQVEGRRAAAGIEASAHIG